MHTELEQDPQAKLPFSWDWSQMLNAGETITVAAITAVTDPRADGLPADLTVGASSISGPVATALVSGGVAGKRYALKCHVTTSAGSEDEHTAYLLILNR